MQNYTEFENGSFYGRLRVKVFSGSPKEIEKQLNELINTQAMSIENVYQSESAADGEFSVTVTVFYITVDPARFITRELTDRQFAEAVVAHIEREYGLSFDEIFDVILDMKHKENQSVGDTLGKLIERKK